MALEVPSHDMLKNKIKEAEKALSSFGCKIDFMEADGPGEIHLRVSGFDFTLECTEDEEEKRGSSARMDTPRGCVVFAADGPRPMALA